MKNYEQKLREMNDKQLRDLALEIYEAIDIKGFNNVDSIYKILKKGLE